MVQNENYLIHAPFEIAIYNCIGQRILNSKMEGGELELDLSIYAKGVYFLQIENFVYKIILI